MRAEFMRVLITGDRHWTNWERVVEVLSALHAVCPDAIIVHGDARGADRIAGEIATMLFGAERVEAWPADWDRHGKAAGPIRNRFMVKESERRAELDGHHLRRGVAFHSDLFHSRGTKDMVSVLEYHNIPVLKIT